MRAAQQNAETLDRRLQVEVVRMDGVTKAEVYHLRAESATDFVEYSEVSISYFVERILAPAPHLGPAKFVEVPQCPGYSKDYDTQPGSHPTDWPRRFDTSGWVVLSAWQGAERVGGLVLAHGNDDVEMLEGRADLAVIWDVRVSPEHRGRGVGSLLLIAATEWASAQGCSELKVETQNVNVPACRFYRRSGFALRHVDPQAYPELPGEAQMLWYKRIRGDVDEAAV